MARSEAQKAADKRYAAKVNGKYKPFIVNLTPEELAYIDGVIKAAGMKKPSFCGGRLANWKRGKNNKTCGLRAGCFRVARLLFYGGRI